jgi:hypothetical protein
VVENLRQLGGSLRTNAERLLRDIQAIHGRLRAEIERVETSGSKGSVSPAPRETVRVADDELDVPEFMPRG